MEDPILRAFVLITGRHARVLGATVFLFLVLGVGFVLITPRGVTQRAVLMPGVTAGEGAVEDVGVLSSRLMRIIEAEVAAKLLPDGVELDARPLIGDPPRQETTDMILLEARARSVEDAARVLNDVERRVKEAHAPIMKEERERLAAQIRSLEASLIHAEQDEISTESSMVYMDLAKEVVETARRNSPARTYDPGFLAVHAPVRMGILRGIVTPILLFVMAGVVVGYGVVFLKLGRAAARHDGQGSSRA